MKWSNLTKELKRMYTEDQADRKKILWVHDPKLFAKRDKVRLLRVLEVIKKKELSRPADYLYAAMILQHGKLTRHYLKAHQFAKKAHELKYKQKKNEVDPLWLAAAAKDRYLMSRGMAQLYGTQFRKNPRTNLWYVWKVNKKITDNERKKWHVPTLQVAYKRAEEMNKRKEY